ncbi:UrcA family protein [Sphingomonas sp. ASY06-1R]|uniref:UrcA family protein n=1 Tax=Sphingomonas sp. ASY06-1R TaxID=3445771 RepID=UPI003FA32875
MLKILPILLLATMTSADAVAQTRSEPVRVSYRDLDMHSADGIRALDRRLLSAVRKVCGDDLSIDTWSKIAARRCHRAKLAEVRALRDAVVARASRSAEAVAAAR